ncbi:hypothetical protein [Saliphagus infecundisoli]|uniref:Uncharacterized protein n=1 Tax=Saliphagus infecundisoli TaxID=1849069 RepID=A0ABD5QB84_9EURY|nr:hypothetical protein [Saliphagus infecundisoli]
MTDEEIDAEAYAPIIRDRAEQLHDVVHESDHLDDTKFDCWGARAILRLAELEADRPAEPALDHEHDAYAHERAATMASIASDLLSAVARSDVVTDVETGRLLAGKTTTHELVADHQQAAHWVREEARRDR